jgi:hypothetical protein
MIVAGRILRPYAGLLFVCKAVDHRKFLGLLVCKRIPTERPPLIGEVNANFCG